MNDIIIYPTILLLLGLLVFTCSTFILLKLSAKASKYLELYPESKGILSFSLRFMSWLIGLMLFLIFIRWALLYLDLQFTVQLAERAILFIPKLVLGLLIILGGYYTSRLVRVRIQHYSFVYKERILLLVDFIIYMTFVFTALYTIGVNILFFLNFYLMILVVIGILVALIVSMVIGIPLGLSIYDRTRAKQPKKRR